MRKTIIITLTATAALALTGCGGSSSAGTKNERIAQSLQGLDGKTNAAENEFIDKLSHSKMSRPWWTYPEESMIEGYKSCGAPNYAVALSDQKGWKFDDAEIFVNAAEGTICKAS